MQGSSQVFIPSQNIHVQSTLPHQQFFQAQQVEASHLNAMVVFILNGNQTVIQCLINEKMRNIINKFNIKSKININNTQYLYNGNQINLDVTFYEQANTYDKQRKVMSILVYTNESIISSKGGLIKSKEIICPNCKENCLISFDDYNIHLYQCKNEHSFNNISFKEFDNNQNINENEIKCYNCNNTKYKSYNKQFYRCLTCKINLCPLCNQKHNTNHEIIDYNLKSYICQNHKDFYVSYCRDCKINLCMKCEKKHNNYHDIINYKNILPDEDEIKKELKEFKNKIDKFKNTIKEIINISNNVYENLQKFYQIFYDIIYNYNLRKRNYETLINVNSVKNFINLKDFDALIDKQNDYGNKVNKIYDIYCKMNKMNNVKNDNIPNMNVIFRLNYNDICIQTNNSCIFAEVGLKFLKRMGVNKIYKFFLNGKELSLTSDKTLDELGITNFSVIDVIET